jgi:hypothetical protein
VGNLKSPSAKLIPLSRKEAQFSAQAPIHRAPFIRHLFVEWVGNIKSRSANLTPPASPLPKAITFQAFPRTHPHNLLFMRRPPLYNQGEAD